MSLGNISMHLSSKEFDLDFLSSRFKDMDFQLFVSNDTNSYISCVACWCKSASKVIENWSAIQNYVSVYYQPSGELALWNIYLAFFCVEDFPLWEKYVIENDKYAVRKLVLNGEQALPNSAQAVSILNNHLLGADLDLKESGAQSERGISLSLSDYVRGAPLDSKVGSREARALRINDIIELLNKDENQKS